MEKFSSAVLYISVHISHTSAHTIRESECGECGHVLSSLKTTRHGSRSWGDLAKLGHKGRKRRLSTKTIKLDPAELLVSNTQCFV